MENKQSLTPEQKDVIKTSSWGATLGIFYYGAMKIWDRFWIALIVIIGSVFLNEVFLKPNLYADRAYGIVGFLSIAGLIFWIATIIRLS